MAIKLGQLKYNPNHTDKQKAYRDSVCYRADLQCQKEILVATGNKLDLMESSKEAKFLLILQIQEMAKRLDKCTAKLKELNVDVESLLTPETTEK